MIAEVYPIKRMPRKMRCFDYEIPVQMVKSVQRGSFVQIPLRNEVILGVVAKTKDIPLRGITLKQICSLDTRTSLIEQEISFFESLSEELVQSVSSILNIAIPEFPKRESKPYNENLQSIPLTIPTSETKTLQQQSELLCERRNAFVYSSDIKRSAALIALYLREKSDQKTLVITPNVLDARRLASALSFLTPLVLTGEEDGKKRFDVWKMFRSQKTGIMIGTKISIFCVGSNVTSIFIVRANHKHHGQHEQNPYYDVRRIAKLYSDLTQTNLFHLDVMPITDDLYNFPSSSLLGSSHEIPHTQLIDLIAERMEKTSYLILPYRTMELIQESLEEHKPILCIFNKTNKSTHSECSNCHTILRCLFCKNVLFENGILLQCVRCGKTEPKLHSCPICQNKLFLQKGMNNVTLASDLQKQFPNANICLLDKEHPIQNKKANIVVTTNYYLESIFDAFSPHGFGLIINLDADSSFFRNTYRAFEEALRDVEEWRAVARANKSNYFVQTASAPLFEEFYANPLSVLTSELKQRQDYRLPPIARITTIRLDEPDTRKAELLLNNVLKNIRNNFPNVQLKKKENTKKNQRMIEVVFDVSEQKKLQKFFREFPDSIRIDMHAESL